MFGTEIVPKMWAKSELVVKGRTAEAKQLSGSDMLRILDVSEAPSLHCHTALAK